MNNIAYFTKKIYLDENERSGMNSKSKYILEAIPEINATNDPAFPCHIMLVEPLGMHDPIEGEPDVFNVHLEKLQNNPAIKITWAEEQMLLRWGNAQRKRLLDTTRHLATCNLYLQQLISPFIEEIPTSILRTPVSSKVYFPQKKQPKIVAMGRVCPEKNISGVIKVFESLPDDIEKVYIGNQGMWAEADTPQNTEYEKELEDVVDRWEPNLTTEEVAEELSTAWGYYNVSIYDVGCLSFLEASMAGCHCFAWNFHPMFDEYVHVKRFTGEEEASSIILNTLESEGLTPDMKNLNHVKSMHDYDMFALALKTLVMEVIFYDGLND